MTFQSVLWSPVDGLTESSFQQMITNDNESKDLIESIAGPLVALRIHNSGTFSIEGENAQDALELEGLSMENITMPYSGYYFVEAYISQANKKEKTATNLWFALGDATSAEAADNYFTSMNANTIGRFYYQKRGYMAGFAYAFAIVYAKKNQVKTFRVYGRDHGGDDTPTVYIADDNRPGWSFIRFVGTQAPKLDNGALS